MLVVLLDTNITAAVLGGISGLLLSAGTLITKRYVETSVYSSKLETEHNFEQRKKVKEVLSKYKVQLLNACEDLSHRLNNFDSNVNFKEMKMAGEYDKESYYFHSFTYRILNVFGWIKKIEHEMIFLDTTLASSKDLDFIKFLRLFPRAFCNLSVVAAHKSNYNEQDSFARNKFETLSDCVIAKNGIKSYSDFVNDLPDIQKELKFLFQFLDGIDPKEERVRWDRLKLLHALLIVFLNNYGYDFQRTNNEKIRKMLCKPHPSKYIKNYPRFFRKYLLDENIEVRQFLELISHFHDDVDVQPLAGPEGSVLDGGENGVISAQ
jgi:hypothetical protein